MRNQPFRSGKGPLLFLFILTLFLPACDTGMGVIGESGGLSGPYSIPRAVNASADPAYTGIVYSQTKFVPPDGTYLLIGGQDKSNIGQIPSAWSLDPGGYAHYFAVNSSNSIWSDFNYEGDPMNLQNAKWIADTHPNAVLQMAMWMVGADMGWDNYPAKTTNGDYDVPFQSFCDFAKTYNRPIFLRIGYEFDGPHNKLQPGEYTNAYRYIVDFIRSRGVTNVAFVWHSLNNTTYGNHPVMSWYPGDDYVDWFGLSVFRGHVWDDVIFSYLETFVDLARSRSKPVMIAESCPNGGITNNNYETWNRWFVPYLSYIHKKNIKAFSYINCDWDKTVLFGTWGWGNTRIQDYPLILTQWKAEISQDKYLKESAGLFQLLGWTN